MMALAARRCGLLPWFTPAIIARLLPAAPPATLDEAIATITALPFVGHRPWGYTFHQDTHAGLLAQQPFAELQAAYTAATPVWLEDWETDESAVAALRGLIITGALENARERLDDLRLRLLRVENWTVIVNVYDVLAQTNTRATMPLEFSAVDYFLTGLAHDELQQYKAALADYGRALALNPEDARAYNNRGNTHRNLQDYAAALADYGRALELNPEYASAYYNTACTYALQSQVEDACTWLQKAIARDEKYRQMARTDSDFDSIRAVPCFQALVPPSESTDD